MLFGRFVAAITNTRSASAPAVAMPSISVRRVATTRRSTSPPSPSLRGHKVSTSSRTIIQGLRFRASANTPRRRSSDSPWYADDSSGPLTTIQLHPGVDDATARARAVLPVPGGPCRSTPRGGVRPNSVKSPGFCRGRSRSERTCLIWGSRPPIRSYEADDWSAGVKRLMYEGRGPVWHLISRLLQGWSGMTDGCSLRN